MKKIGKILDIMLIVIIILTKQIYLFVDQKPFESMNIIQSYI